MKTIQIALDEGLLKEVDQAVANRFNNRAEFINKALTFFLRYLQEQQLDQVYKKGYEQIPEEPDMAQVSALLAGETMTRDDWQ
ncbi:MAG: ribbon-helix-helix domain-containing protein [bacterium]